MRLVAGVAGEGAGVLVGVDLREALGFGSAGRMAADAEDGGVELWRGDGWVVCVLRQGAVAGFTVHAGVLAGFFGVEEIIKVDIRVVSATNCDLARRMEEGKF